MTGWGNTTEVHRLKRKHAAERARWATERRRLHAQLEVAAASIMNAADLIIEADETLSRVRRQRDSAEQRFGAVLTAAAVHRGEFDNDAGRLVRFARVLKALAS